jgi:hypothetical protein
MNGTQRRSGINCERCCRGAKKGNTVKRPKPPLRLVGEKRDAPGDYRALTVWWYRHLSWFWKPRTRIITVAEDRDLEWRRHVPTDLDQSGDEGPVLD